MAPMRRGGNPALVIEHGPAYEFLMSVVTLAEVAHRSVIEIGGEWLDRVEQRAGPNLVRRLHDFGQGTGDPFIHLVPFAYDTPAPRSAEALLRHLAELDAEQVVLQMIGYYEYHYRRTTPPETMLAAVRGDRKAVGEFLRSVADWEDWREFLAHHLGRSATDIRKELLALLADWHVRVWQEEEQHILPILERDAEAKRLLATEMDFDQFVETATNGVRFVAHPGIDRLVLVPSYVNRPWVSDTEHRGAMILVYPVADESVSAERDSPPLRLVRLAKALADEKRLRILRALAEQPRSLGELAQQFELPKTTMHHHMVTLRSAGLVSVSAGTKDYRLRQEALPDLVQMLGGYIGTEQPPTARDDAAPAGTRSAGTGSAGNGRRGRRREASPTRAP